MKKKTVFGAVLLAVLVLQAQTVFAADYNADFLKEVGRNNFANMERILQRRSSQMDPSYTCMGTVLRGNISGFNKNNAIQVLQLLVRFGAEPDKSYYSPSNGTIRYFSALNTILNSRRNWSRSQLFEICQYLFSVGANPNGLDGIYAPGLDSRQNVYLSLSIYNDEDLTNLFLENGLLAAHHTPTSNTNINVDVQPSAPAQATPSEPERNVGKEIADAVSNAFQPPLDNGTYRMSGGAEQIVFAGIARGGNISYKDAAGTTHRGTYSIDGTRLTINVMGKSFFYTINSKTSFSGNGESWFRVGF